MLACFALAACGEKDPLEAIRQQQASGDFEGTIEPLRELLKTRPDDAETNFLYGRALSYSQPNLAVWSLRKAMEDPEWLVPAGAQLAYLSLTGEDFKEVIKITGRILEHDPENVRALLMRANAHAHSKQDPELALADAKRVLEIDRDTTEAYEPLILALLDHGKLKEAGEALAEAGRRLAELGLKEDVVAWHCVTTSVFEQESGQLEQARKTWKECLEKHPTNVDVVIERGQLLRRGRRAGAVARDPARGALAHPGQPDLPAPAGTASAGRRRGRRGRGDSARGDRGRGCRSRRVRLDRSRQVPPDGRRSRRRSGRDGAGSRAGTRERRPAFPRSSCSNTRMP